MNYLKQTLLLIISQLGAILAMERPIKRAYESNQEEQQQLKKFNRRAIFHDPRLFFYLAHNYSGQAIRKSNTPGE